MYNIKCLYNYFVFFLYYRKENERKNSHVYYQVTFYSRINLAFIFIYIKLLNIKRNT